MSIEVDTSTGLRTLRAHGGLDRRTAARLAVAAFAVLVFRYTRQEDLTITVHADGDEPLARLRLDVSSGTTMSDLLVLVERQLGAEELSRTIVLAWSLEGEGALTLRVLLDRHDVDASGFRVEGALATLAFARVALHFRAAVLACRYGSSSALGRVALLDEAERELLGRWIAPENEPSIAAPPRLLHSLFERQAQAHPERVAVVCKGREVSYGELDARADRLARGLRARGVGAGDFVAFQLPRSIDVYVALLGVLKSGAAYVPLDPEYPRDRIEYILGDCGVKALLTVSSLAPAPGGAAPVLLLDEDWDGVFPEPARAPQAAAETPGRAPTPSDVCYVIYTSGSTGKPKGVAVEHRSAAHLVLAEQRIFRIEQSDRVYQGFSIAFDAAVEEVWLAFAAGATLVVGTKEAMVSGLARTLAEQRVTVLSTVPTLLTTVEEDLPGVRLLIVGGEACPQSLVERFATPARAMFNTYGPTEATVIATYGRLHPKQRVTIGTPVANYHVYILDPDLRLAPAGVAGEICIGGVGVARGYVGKPELTDARFVRNPYFAQPGAPAVIYRTGDRGRYDAEGRIEFLGRVDDQVKLRGFRVELGEIEGALVACGAAQAVAMVREDAAGLPQLVAYVAPVRGAGLTESALKERLRAQLPPYMVPAHVEVLEAMPTLRSGKVDKKSLPPPSSRPAAELSADDAPRGALEGTIARCWAELFGLPAVSRTQNFFLDLGGHSLLAAQMISRLRRRPELAALSVLDVYEHPTVAALADLAKRHAREPERRPSDAVEAPERVSPWRHAACGAAQIAGLYGVFAIYSTQWLGPYLTYMALRSGGEGVAASLLTAAGVLFAVYPLMLVLAVVTKWLVIGRYKPGRYPLWGTYYFRCWLVDQVLALAPTGFFAGTPLLNGYYRLLGARIGRNVHLASDSLGCFDLITIGDDTSIGDEADVRGNDVRGGAFVVGSVHIGRRCAVAPRAVLTHDVSMGDDAALGEISLLPPGASVPEGERWAGSPARFASRTDRAAPVSRATPRRQAVLVAGYALAALAMPLFVVAALFPGLALLTWLDHRVGLYYLLASPLVATIFIVLLCLEIVAVKWLLLGRVRAGRYDVHGGFFFRKWLFDQAMGLSLDELGSLYATLFLNPWYRLLGARVGKNAEVSTASGVTPDLLHIGDEAFVADCVSLGAPWVERGTLHLRETRVGRRSFVGNSAVVAGGCTVGDDCLVGCLSLAPPQTQNEGAWFGSPPVALPRRQASTAFPASSTYEPTRRLVALRVLFDSLRVTLPTTCCVLLSCLLIRVSLALSSCMSLGAFVALFPCLYVAFGVAAAALVVALKWIVVGRYRPGEEPLWSTFVWRAELVTAMHENLANTFFVDKLDGTPFIAWFFRALGARIGRRVYMGTTELTEYDLVSVGDEASLGEDCTLQTHLFEDRVMKMSTVRVGARCTVGSDAVVLYDTQMEEGSSLAPLSLLMKGETLPAGSSWQGSPARPARRKESER